MSKQLNNQALNLNNLSTEQLRAMLKQLQTKHDILQAKNEQSATHISDIRSAVKKIESEKDEQLSYTIQKKKKLQDQIQRSKAALRVANSKTNTMFSDMMAFKELQQNQND